MDALFAPMYSVAGTLVGILSVDLPDGGRRPDEVQCALLEMYATQAGIAIDNARLVARVRASEESFRLAFENAPVGMSLVDLTAETSGRFLRVNEAMSRMLGRSRRELETMSIRDVTHPDDHAGDLDIVARAVAGEIERYQLEKRYVHADGHPVWVSLQTSVVRDGTGRALYGISQFEDISDRRAEHQELTRRARIDPLTGLLNRSALAERVQEAITAARRNRRAGAVLFCDLDDFKPVNDTLGHAFGDQVLAIIAKRLESQVRAGDTTARFGGDEFVIVTDDLSDDEMDDLVDRLRTAVAAPVDVGGTSVSLSVTVGRARVTGGPDETPDGLIAAADVDMYLRKPGAKGAHDRGRV
jgi:diguanylate cyclase (GGDEF)-like protein/PAS domain S-box-containing protein